MHAAARLSALSVVIFAAFAPAQAIEPQAPEKLITAEEAVLISIRSRLTNFMVPAKPTQLQKGAAIDRAGLAKFYATLGEQADEGNETGRPLWVGRTGLTDQARAALREIGNAAEWGLSPDDFDVPEHAASGDAPLTPSELVRLEMQTSLSILKYARYARGGRMDPTDLSLDIDRKPPLLPADVVLKGAHEADNVAGFLQGLHPKHEQFERLRQALPKAQSEEEDERLRSNMDRWRWMPETLGDSYVWLNIPEFKLHVLEDGKTVQFEKIVVGNPSTPTPVLSAEMTEIVFNPERIVPLSLIRKEVLPKLKGGNDFFGRTDTSVLDQYQITVKRRGQPVDPSTIDWKTVNPATLTFVQAPGRTNILGKVQFLYPNDRGVYLHDTIISSQLARAVRAEGNKEPRVGNPDRVAARLLAKSNGMSGAKVNQLVGGGTTSRVKLDTPIPIHMTYFTAVVDEQGKVQTFNDVYKLDGRGKPDDAAAASPAPAAGTAPIPSRKPLNRNLAATVP